MPTTPNRAWLQAHGHYFDEAKVWRFADLARKIYLDAIQREGLGIPLEEARNLALMELNK